MEFIRGIFILPDVFLSLLIFVGLILQKRRVAEIISGTVKTLLGYNFILFGGRIIAGAAQPLVQMFTESFQVNGTVLNVEAATGVALNVFGADIAVVLCLGIAVNLILAKFSRYHYVFATGHQALYMACIFVCVLRSCNVTGAIFYLLAALGLGFILTFSPAIVQPYTALICRNNKIALGHFGSFAYFLAAKIGKIVGDPNSSAEKLKIPTWLGFIRETPVVLFLTIATINFIAATFAGAHFVQKNLSGGQHYLIYAMSLATQFTIGSVLISTGIRWLVDEIVPAVRGFAKSWLPGAIPTVDCPLVFPYAPNSLVIGFISSFAAGIFSVFVMFACNLPIILPGAVPHFFCGATSGIYGNITGGLRGAVVGSFVNGLIISFLPLLAINSLAGVAQSGVAFADSDFNLTAILFNFWLNRVGDIGTLILILCIILLTILIPETLENRDKNIPWFLEHNIYERKRK